jgi:hypothetical protein
VQRGGHQPADKSADREPDEQGEQHCVIHTSQTAVPPRQCRRGAPPRRALRGSQRITRAQRGEAALDSPAQPARCR